MEQIADFNVIGNENAIIPSAILHTMRDMQEVLEELNILTAIPSPSDEEIKEKIEEGDMDSTSFSSILGALGASSGNIGIADPEIAADKKFMQCVGESFSQCSAMDAKIKQKLDELDNIVSKSMDISRYTQDEQSLVAQVETIYKTLYNALESIVENLFAIKKLIEIEKIMKDYKDNNDKSGDGIRCSPFLRSYFFESTLVRDTRDKLMSVISNRNPFVDISNGQDSPIIIPSISYGDSVRKRKREYMRYIHSIKECAESIQNILDTSTSHAVQNTIEAAQSTQAQNVDKDTGEAIQPHEKNPFIM